MSPPSPEADPEAGRRGRHEDKPSRARRPRWLLLALVLAFAFGAGCWMEGCARLSFYRGDPDSRTAEEQQLGSEAARSKADALYQRYADVADAERARAIPLAAATFVLGAALLFLALQALMGRSSARRLLVQVVAAQALVVAIAWFATKRVRQAEWDWDVEQSLLVQQERFPQQDVAPLAAFLRASRDWGPAGWLGFRTLASAFIVLALTRPKAREFFDAAAGAPET